MAKIFKKTILFLLFFLSLLGLIISATIYIVTFTGEKHLPLQVYSVILGIPVLFIPAVIITLIEIRKYKGHYFYGIRFWPAIRNVPKLLALAVYFFISVIVFSLCMDAQHAISESAVISSGMSLFYYIPTIIYLSTFIGVR